MDQHSKPRKYGFQKLSRRPLAYCDPRLFTSLWSANITFIHVDEQGTNETCVSTFLNNVYLVNVMPSDYCFMAPSIEHYKRPSHCD